MTPSSQGLEPPQNPARFTLEFYSLRCPGRQHVKTWMKLERGLLLVFRERFGVIPVANKQGKRMKWIDELSFFTRSRLSAALEKYS
jgi:hypothetical protein